VRICVVGCGAVGSLFAANLALLSVLIAFGLDKVLAQAIAILVVTPLNFIGNKLWSFRSRA